MTSDTEKRKGQHLVAPVASPQCHALSSVLYLLTPAFLFLNLLERQVSHCFGAPRLSRKGRCCCKGKTWGHRCERVRSTHSAQSLPWLDKETEVKDKVHYFFRGLVFSILTKSGFFLRFSELGFMQLAIFADGSWRDFPPRQEALWEVFGARPPAWRLCLSVSLHRTGMITVCCQGCWKDSRTNTSDVPEAQSTYS